MKPSRIALLGSLLAAFAAAASAQQTAEVPPASPAPAPGASAAPYTDAQLMELYGWAVARQGGIGDLPLSAEETAAVLKGFSEALNRQDAPVDPQRAGPLMEQLVRKIQTDYLNGLKNKNVQEDAAFFAQLKQNPDIQETPSGLRYEILNPGTGPNPKPTDTVRVNYEGKLIDGTVFDSSYKRGQPAEFTLDGVIPGWTEGIQKIAKGGKIRLYIPPDLAYGDQGRPGIPPGAALIFDVELLDIKPAAPAPAPAPNP